jgi:rhodanese-related sulfurtransferase
MTRMLPADLDERLSADDSPFVLDIRPESDYRDDAIEGSYSVPVYDALRGGEETPLRNRLDEVPSDREVVVVCKMGVVAKRATGVLDDAGYDAATLAGGMHGWNGYRNGTLTYRLRSLVWRVF